MATTVNCPTSAVFAASEYRLMVGADPSAFGKAVSRSQNPLLGKSSGAVPVTWYAVGWLSASVSSVMWKLATSNWPSRLISSGLIPAILAVSSTCSRLVSCQLLFGFSYREMGATKEQSSIFLQATTAYAPVRHNKAISNLLFMMRLIND